MKAQVKVSPTTILEIEAPTQKDLFKAMAMAHEVFGEKQCGHCKGKNNFGIVPAWRTATRVTGKKTETFEYPEYRCLDPNCRARLSLGINNDTTGNMFPHRRLDANGQPTVGAKRSEGSFGDHNGWFVFQPQVQPKEE